MSADAGTEGNISSTYCKIWVYPDSCSVAGRLLLYLSTGLLNIQLYSSWANKDHYRVVSSTDNPMRPYYTGISELESPQPYRTTSTEGRNTVSSIYKPKPETSMDLGLGSAGAGTISGVQKPHARTKISRA
jgi:hypothetical protein